MKIFWKILAAVLCLLLLYFGLSPLVDTSWSTEAYNPKGDSLDQTSSITDPNIIKASEDYAVLMKNQDIEGLKAVTDPSILNEKFYKVVPEIAKYSMAEKPTNVRVLNYTSTKFKALTGDSDTWTNTTVTIAHYHPTAIIFTTTTFHEENNKRLVRSFNLNRFSYADINQIKFNLNNRPSVNYVILGIGIINLFFSLTTLYICLTRKDLAFRWLWAPFVAFGIGQFLFNWTNGHLSFDFSKFQVPQLAFTQNIAEAAVIHIWFPLGAILFWMLAKQKNVKPVTRPSPFDGHI